MVFGRPADYWRHWQPRFAWKPVKLIDGRWVWLEHIEVTGFVQNREIEPRTPFNCRLMSTSFCARLARREAPDAAP